MFMAFAHGIRNMFMTLDATCNDIALLNIIKILKNILDIIHIIGPIALMIAIAINLTKIVTMDDISKEKKLQKNIQNSIIATIILFLLPSLINLSMGMINNVTNSHFDLSSCWEYSNHTSIKSKGAYISKKTSEQNKNKPTTVYTKPSDYKGEVTNNGSSNNGTSNNGTGANTTLPSTKAARRIFVGDSRTVQMYIYLYGSWDTATTSRLQQGTTDSKGDLWSAKGGEGLNWMQSTGMPNIESNISKGTALIILMGVNDTYNANNYVSYVNSRVDGWKSKGANVYFVSVLPCNGNYTSHNTKINEFNNIIKSSLSSKVTYLDVSSYLYSVGFTSGDGLHYDQNTYQNIYNKIMSMV